VQRRASWPSTRRRRGGSFVSGTQVVVRDAGPDDIPALADLWGLLRNLSNRGDIVPPPTMDGVLERLSTVAADERARILIAELHDAVAGFAVLTVDPLAPLYESPAVQINYLLVRPQLRRRGVGRAILTAATAYAEQVGAEHVVVSVFPAVRDANRYFARLGFSPMTVRRVAAVSTLRRRLSLDGRARGEDVARRRMRARSRVRAAMTRVAELPAESASGTS
jgi:N-acetylglutamate synthase-like GNAT family acetyltransferase